MEMTLNEPKLICLPLSFSKIHVLYASPHLNRGKLTCPIIITIAIIIIIMEQTFFVFNC